MNPIHEAGFASLFVLAFATAPGGLFSLLGLVLARWKPKAGAILSAMGAISTALVLLLSAVTTVKLHHRIDYWIDTGGYGPPADIHRTYGPEWHESARLTAIVGVVLSALPLLFSLLGYKLARRERGWGTGGMILGGACALALGWCLIMCVA